MSEYVLKEYPDPSALQFDYQSQETGMELNVNAHLHTPYSYSYFDSIREIFQQAVKENVKVLGINDFFLADGFPSFYEEALKNKIFPIFNIEIVGLMLEEQYDRFRINDPVNPGRTYLSGKGLDYPFRLDEDLACRLLGTRNEIQLHVKEIIGKANKVLSEIDEGLTIRFSEIKRLYAREFVTERHVSKAIRELVYNRYEEAKDRLQVLGYLLGEAGKKIELDNHAACENFIRSHFLKSGGKAFIKEEHSAFLPVAEVLKIILNAGGIPCYSVLLDNEKGRCTEYEANKQILLNELLSHNIRCIEFIPSRNHPEILKDYVLFFREHGFIVLFGTAHSSPERRPLRVCTRGEVLLDEELSRISEEGARIIAAHQYLRAKGETGFIKPDGSWKHGRMEEFSALGRAVIHRFVTS